MSQLPPVRTTELSAGAIDYYDTGGDGPAVVLLNGVFVGASVWRYVMAGLAPAYRCVALELPLGAHRRPMRPGADLTGVGIARLVAEFLDRLGLDDVTLVGLDWGGAQLVVAHGLDVRVSRLVLLSQEAYDNYPPGLPGKLLSLAMKVPGGLTACVKQLRWRPMRRLPATFGWMSKRPVPHDVTDGWLHGALTDPAVRRDVRRYFAATRSGEYVEVAAALAACDKPALVLWGTEDRVMPVATGRKLAAALPRARLVEVADSYTLIPEDQPAACTSAIRSFLTRTATGSP